MTERNTIFENSIRKAVKSAIGEENEENIDDYVNKISILLNISLRNMPSQDVLKGLISELIEE